MRRLAPAAITVALTLPFMVGCGSGDSDATQAASSASSVRKASILGRWEVLRTCDGIVQALAEAGLGELAPSVVGDYFPDKSPKQLARKADVCEGATPQRHSHFFTRNGQFDSIDQHGAQVDGAAYHVVGEGTLHLSVEFGEETYRYRIADGNNLILDPVIPPRAKRPALENPLEFSLPGHMAAVAYTGHSWTRVDCEDWC